MKDWLCQISLLVRYRRNKQNKLLLLLAFLFCSNQRVGLELTLDRLYVISAEHINPSPREVWSSIGDVQFQKQNFEAQDSINNLNTFPKICVCLRI